MEFPDWLDLKKKHYSLGSFHVSCLLIHLLHVFESEFASVFTFHVY